MDAMTATAFGSGLTALGRGLGRYNESIEEKRRYDEGAQARTAEQEEQRKLRRELANLQAQATRDARVQRAMQQMTDFYGKQGVVLSPDAARRLAEADEQGPNAPPGTVDAMIATATGAEATVPTGDELAASPVDNGYSRGRITETARRALERSRAEGGSRVALEGDLGFARDEDAFSAARRKEQADADRAMREMIARITAGSRTGSQGATRLNAMIGDQEQVLKTNEDLMPKRKGLATVIGGSPLDAVADSTFRADSTTAAGNIGRERSRLDALKMLRGDSELMSSLGAEPLSVTPSAPTPGPGQPRTQLAQQVQQALAAIQAKVASGEITPQEGQARVQKVKQRAMTMQGAGGSR